MREDRSVMSYRLMKWALFTVLLLTAPALLFRVQVVMFIPAIFFAAGILFMIPKAVVSSSSMETLTFIGIFGVHLLIYAGINMTTWTRGTSLFVRWHGLENFRATAARAHRICFR